MQSDDWAWLIDHSVQIGQEKCLVILGIRLLDLPQRGQSLRHEDLELIELMPAKSWTRREVDQALEKAIQRTGVALQPRTRRRPAPAVLSPDQGNRQSAW